MKILKNIINVTIRVALVLCLVVVFALRFDGVQQFIGGQVAQLLGKTLGTRVEVGKVDLGFLNRIIVDDVKLYDQKGKQMLTAARLTAKIDIAALADSKIEISSAQIFSAHFRLYRQNVGQQHNFQFVLDSLSSKDNKEKKPLNLRINSLIVRHSSVVYDQYDKIKTPGKLNPSHLAVTDINSHIILRKLTNDSINLNIKKLSLKEHSGLSLERLSLLFEAGRHGASLSNFYLKLPDTRMELGKVTATYSADSNMHIKEGTLSYTMMMKPSKITISDFAFLAPKLSRIDQGLYINAGVHGTYAGSVVDYVNVNTLNEDIVVNVAAQIRHLKGRKPEMDINLKKIEIAPSAVDKVISAFTDRHIPESMMRFGVVRIGGRVYTAADTKVATHINIRSAAGVASVDGRLSANDNVSGSITTDNFDLGYLLDNAKLGTFTANLQINGNIHDRKNPVAYIKGNVADFIYNNHQFNDIRIDANYSIKRMYGNVSIDNPDLALNVRGSLDTSQKSSRVTLDGQVINLAPQSLRITDKYGNARFSTHIAADFTGTDINTLCGTLDINDLKMVSETDYYHLDNLKVTSGYDSHRHYLSLVSDFGNIEISGHYDYSSLSASFVKILKKHMPTMPGLPQHTVHSDNNFSISATLTKSDWMNKFLGVDLVLIEPLMLTGNVDDRNGEMSLNLDGASYEYNGKQYGKSHLDIQSTDDSMTASANVTQANSNGRNITYSVDAIAADNCLNTCLSWKNNGTGIREKSGTFKAMSQFYTGNGGERTADIKIGQSHININGARWDVASSDIRYYKDMVAVHNFSVSHGDQHLTINGKASKSPGDSLVVDLKDVDVEYVLDLVNFHSVNFSGMASGKAYIMSPFGKLEANASLKVRDFKFEHGRMGTLNASVAWNNDEKQIDIHGICNDGPDAMTFVDGYVSPKRNYIDLDINAAGTYIDFMQSFTKSFAEGFTGRANGKVKLAGPLSTINLTGMLVVDGEAKMKALNCKYFLNKDTVRLVPDEIELRDAVIRDIYGNRGYVNGFIHHKHLTRLSYDLNVRADNLLAYDFKEFDGSTFCGTVYADGSVDISGRSGELTIDVNCTPQKNSVFAYNTSSPDAITNQEFIRWNDITPVDTMATSAVLTNADDDGNDNIASDIYINFLINCQQDATLRLLMDSQTNDYITLNGSGVLRASYYNKGAFKMFGTYLIDHGTYSITIQNIIKKYFVFNRGGTIVFGGDPYDAALNMQAVYTVNGVSLSDLSTSNAFSQKSTTRVNCLMNIGGQAKRPQVTFDLDMPTMDTDEKQMVNALINTEDEKNQQVLYLLGIGRFYPQAENNAGAEQASRTSLAMQSILSGTISGQINNLLNTVLKSDNWNFGANISTGDEGWNNAEYEGIVNGRMLNDRLLFNGEFGYRDNANTANTSFIGDFNIQYNLTPNGNLSVKVYNETNDRYFTKSSLNTQGVGFVVKRDFSNWRDFWGTRKRGKGSKKR